MTFKSLVSSQTVSMIITKTTTTGRLKYYLVGNTTNHTIITKGIDCEGSIPNDIMTFTVNMESIYKIISIGINLKISVIDGKVVFTSETADRTIMLKPLCIEYSDDTSTKGLSTIQSFLKERDNGLEKHDLKRYADIANIAAAANTVVEICGTYAAVTLPNAYFISKEDCGLSCVLSGRILQTLLHIKGDFYTVGSKLIFASEDDSVFAIINVYLPSTSVNLTLLNGKRVEEYEIEANSFVSLITSLYTSYPDIIFDMGESKVVLSNENNESVSCSFKISKLLSSSMEKLKKNPNDASITVKLSAIRLPIGVARFMRLFKGYLCIFVFKNKVVLKNKFGTLYLIFGR